MLLDALVKELEIKGSLNVLRHGFKFYGKLFRLAYFKPAHALSPDVLTLYGQNQLTLIRQVPCHPGDHSTVDMVLAVNGLPVATIELKNPGTHQTWRHAVKQYQGDRDPRAPLTVTSNARPSPSWPKRSSRRSTPSRTRRGAARPERTRWSPRQCS